MPTPKQVLVIGGLGGMLLPSGLPRWVQPLPGGKGRLGGTCPTSAACPPGAPSYSGGGSHCEAKEIGLEVAGATVNLDQLGRGRKGGPPALPVGRHALEGQWGKVVKGTASFIRPKGQVQLVDGERKPGRDRVIIATGSVPVSCLFRYQSPGIWDVTWPWKLRKYRTAPHHRR